ncbi:MAG: response regulator [Lachnospiraceae bacterium]|nr:response regulator [Lachnospiraceae bacterium]
MEETEKDLSHQEQDAAKPDVSNDETQSEDAYLSLMNQYVRGPLYSILELTRLAKENALDRETLQAYLNKMSSSGAAINEAMDDIASLKQIASDKISLHEKQLNLADFLDITQKELSRTLSEKGISFKTDFEDFEDIFIFADHSMLTQTLRKLVHGFAENVSRGGHVVFHAKSQPSLEGNVSIHFCADSPDASIEEDRFFLLSLPYEELQGKINANASARDVNLIILKSYAHTMGTDEIIAEEKEDGTSICLSLTFRKVPLAEIKNKRKNYDFTGKRILVADDDEINLEIVEKLLRDKGAEVVTVRDGRETLYTFRAEHGIFDLILMDIVMPELNGLEVARQIRQITFIPNAKTIPIIAMTVNAFQENYDQSIEAGMNEHLVKPINPERLFRTIAELI